MGSGLSQLQILLLCGYACGMTFGQLMFKFAASGLSPHGSLMERLFLLIQSGFFIVAVAVYFVLSVFWVWLLSFTPLSRAFPFTAISFALVPIFANAAFGEPLGLRLVGGIALLLVALVIIGT